MEIPITSGGPEGVVAVPAGELLAELEHAPSSSAAAEHATAVQPDRFMVFIIRFPHVLGCAAGVGTRVSRGGGLWLHCFQSGNTVTVTVLVYPVLVND